MKDIKIYNLFLYSFLIIYFILNFKIIFKKIDEGLIIMLNKFFPEILFKIF
jgi:hypothetical protein